MFLELLRAKSYLPRGEDVIQDKQYPWSTAALLNSNFS